jgi:hypothetical protein
MNNTITYHNIENKIYFIDGILSFLKATRTKLFLAILLYLLVFVFERVLKKPIEFTKNRDTLIVQYDEIKQIYDKFGKVIPIISAMNNPFFPERFRKRFYRYEEFLENLVDGLAISVNKEAKESVQKLPSILKDMSKKLPTLDDVLKTL